MEDKKIFFMTFALNRSTKKSMSLANGNEMISANDQINFHVRAALVNHLRSLANIEARQCIGDLPENVYLYSKQKPCYILIHISPPSNRRMDAPNWYPTIKPLIDGFTDAHVFEDDNDDVITSLTFLRGPKTMDKKYHITIEIREGML